MNNQLRFGTAKDIITPCTRTTMMGFGSVYGTPFKSIHDDLYVRTLLLQDDSNSILLIGLDLCFHDDSLPETLRAYAYKKYMVPRDNLLVIYSHTHYGPTVKGYDLLFYSDEYEDFLYQRIIQCIDRAFLNVIEGTLTYASVEGDWNISRRILVDGVMQFKPNLDGDRDKSIYILKLSDVRGHVRALLTNFACHPSNLNSPGMLSSEFPGRLCHLLEAQNYGCTALFFQGCGADTKLRIGAKSSRFHPISFDECNEVASAMALRVQNTLLNGKWQDIEPALASKIFQIRMPLDVYPRSFFEENLQRYSQNSKQRFDKSMIIPGEDNSLLMMWSRAGYILDHYDEMPDDLMLNCGIIRLSKDFYIFTVGGEPSYDVKRVLQQVLPSEYTMLFFGYNDAIAYVPSDKVLAEGGYEGGDRSVVEYRLKGKFKKGIDRLFMEGFKNALDNLH